MLTITNNNKESLGGHTLSLNRNPAMYKGIGLRINTDLSQITGRILAMLRETLKKVSACNYRGFVTNLHRRETNLARGQYNAR